MKRFQARVEFLLLFLFLIMLFSGCSNFSTHQVDRSYEDGKLVREIITDVSANALVDSKSELSRFRATTTDKTQSTSVGGLNQESNATNTVNDAAIFLGTLIKTAR